MKAASGLLLAATLLLPAAPAHALEAVLQGLDKVTARISTITAPIGQMVHFGSLDITVAQCTKKPPDEPPETSAFLTIFDNRPGGQKVKIFSGWMFASSPALNALEHPVFDVTLVDCREPAPPAPARPAPAPAQRPAPRR